MSTRALSDHEVLDFLNNNPDINGLVMDHENLYLVEGHLWKWDQIAAAKTDDSSLYPIPPRGLAVTDSTYGNVVIYPDAKGLLHFVATDNQSLVNEINKPLYTSDPDYFQVFTDLLQKFGEHLPTFPQLNFGLAAVAAIVIGAVFLSRR